MGLVDIQWRPLGATLWIADIVYLMSRTMHQLALGRVRLRILGEPIGGAPILALSVPGDSHRSDTAPSGRPTPPPEPAVPDSSAPAVPPEQPHTAAPSVPLSVVAGALVFAAIVVAGVAFLVRSVPNDSAGPLPRPGVAPVVDTAAPAAAPIDLRLRSGRMDDANNCIGTFEVTHGTGTRARLVAFAMDTSGAIIARDSAQVTSAVTGMFVDFRFRNVDCDKIDDWQIQATTSAQPPR